MLYLILLFIGYLSASEFDAAPDAEVSSAVKVLSEVSMSLELFAKPKIDSKSEYKAAYADLSSRGPGDWLQRDLSGIKLLKPERGRVNCQQRRTKPLVSIHGKEDSSATVDDSTLFAKMVVVQKQRFADSEDSEEEDSSVTDDSIILAEIIARHKASCGVDEEWPEDFDDH